MAIFCHAVGSGTGRDKGRHDYPCVGQVMVLPESATVQTWWILRGCGAPHVVQGIWVLSKLLGCKATVSQCRRLSGVSPRRLSWWQHVHQ